MQRWMDLLESTIAKIDGHFHAMAVEQARARGDIEELKRDMVTRSEFHSVMNLVLTRLDGIAGSLADMRYDMAKQNHRLDDLEARPS